MGRLQRRVRETTKPRGRVGLGLGADLSDLRAIKRDFLHHQADFRQLRHDMFVD